MVATLETHLPDLAPPRRGKVREVYDLGSEVLIVATDRISAFDVVMANGIPDKGKILTQMSNFWFEFLSSVCPNHILAISDEALRERFPQDFPQLQGRAVIARKAVPLPIECVVRGYITGSLLKDYVRHGSNVHRLGLREGLVDGSKLAAPIFSPATKAQEGHDENLSPEQAVELVGKDTYEQVSAWSIELYSRAASHALDHGIILADTKFEFGATAEGLIWIDEALTPDSSRFWAADQYEPGRSQPSFDKQFVRDYLESIAWNKMPPGPTLPENIVEQTRAKYLEAFRRLTGRSLAA